MKTTNKKYLRPGNQRNRKSQRGSRTFGTTQPKLSEMYEEVKPGGTCVWDTSRKIGAKWIRQTHQESSAKKVKVASVPSYRKIKLQYVINKWRTKCNYTKYFQFTQTWKYRDTWILIIYELYIYRLPRSNHGFKKQRTCRTLKLMNKASD